MQYIDVHTVLEILKNNRETPENKDTWPDYPSEYILINAITEIEKYAQSQEFTPVELIEENKNGKRYHCGVCGVKHSIYKVYFSAMHVGILRKVFKYCIENKTHIINKKEIKTLSHTDYGNFYILRRFGFLYWINDESGKNIKGGNWGVAVSRIYDFLNGYWPVAEYSEKHTQSEKVVNSDKRIYIHDVPNHSLEYNPETLLPTFVEYINLAEYFHDNNFNQDF